MAASHLYSPPSTAGLTTIFSAANRVQADGTDTPPSPGSLRTAVAIAPVLDGQMEQLVHSLETGVGQARGDPQQEAINNANARLWRIMADQLQFWATAVDNHKYHIVEHYRYLSAASKKVKQLHDNSKDKFDQIVKKVKEIEGKLDSVHDFPNLVAGEVQKHHGAFVLVGSEVSRMHQELNAVKGALEKVVHTFEY